MNLLYDDIELICAPSILGLKPGGVEDLAESLLSAGLVEILQLTHPVIQVPTLNRLYSEKRDPQTSCMNAQPIKDFSLALSDVVSNTINRGRFAFVLGGDCSILLGIMPALKIKAAFGLIFLDAHADFYSPEKSITGEVADMDLAIVTGHGPGMLTNINNLQPFVMDKNVIHIGQRDWEETIKYGSPDIRGTDIKCFDLATIEKNGIHVIITEVLQHIHKLKLDGFWIHFDTDVLSDEINPAVDYRLPGGLHFDQVEILLKSLLSTGRIAGISVTIFNPKLDHNGNIAKSITKTLGSAFDREPPTPKAI